MTESDKVVSPPQQTETAVPPQQEQQQVQQQVQQQPDQTSAAQQEVNLLNFDVKNENDALNVLVGFIGLAQKRGTFAIHESAKIWNCIQVFRKKSTTTE